MRFLSSVRCIAEEQFAKRQKGVDKSVVWVVVCSPRTGAITALDAAFSAVRRGIDLCYTNLADENTADNQYVSF